MTAFLSGIWGRLAALGAVLLALAVMLGKARQSGQEAERAAAAARITSNLERANEADRRINAAGGAERRRLRDKWTRE
jgi:Tfp pilus assembly protein PilV